MSAVAKILMSILLAIMLSVPCAGATGYSDHDDALPGEVVATVRDHASNSAAHADNSHLHGNKAGNHCNPDRMMAEDSDWALAPLAATHQPVATPRDMIGRVVAVVARPPII